MIKWFVIALPNIVGESSYEYYWLCVGWTTDHYETGPDSQPLLSDEKVHPNRGVFQKSDTSWDSVQSFVFVLGVPR